MTVKTPKYWETEEFQPLVEAETAFGHKVKVPENLLDIWAIWERRKTYVLQDLERAKADGWFKAKIHRMIPQDLKRVFFEQYKPTPMDDICPPNCRKGYKKQS